MSKHQVILNVELELSDINHPDNGELSKDDYRNFEKWLKLLASEYHQLNQTVIKIINIDLE